MEDVITIATNLSTKGFEKGSKAMKQAVNSLSRAAQNMGRQVERGARGALGTFKRLLPTILGVGSAFGIISKAVNAFMSQNEQLASKMQAVWTALGNVLAPIITQIINWVTTAVSYFLEFLRLLGVTGKTASELSKKANQSTAQLQKTLAGFDELNVMSDNQGKKDATLDDVEPSEWMQKIADLLKNKMWDEAADMIIDKLNNIIYAIRDKAEEIGQKIGEYLQGIIHIIARVLDEVDWKQLGVGIANFFNGLLAEVEGINLGEDLGKIIAAKFTVAFKIITGFLETFNFGRFGEIFSEMIKSAFDSMSKAIDQANPELIGQNIANFFNKIDWVGVGTSIANFLNKMWDFAVTSLTTFIRSLKPEEIAAGLAAFFNGIDWKRVATGILDLLSAAWDFAITFLSNFIRDVNWEDIGAAIRAFFDGIDWEKVKNDIFGLLKDAWDAAWDLLKGFLNGDSEEDIPIVKKLTKLKESIEKLNEAVAPLIEKIWTNGLKPILDYTVDTILPTFFEDLAKAIGDLADILSGKISLGEFVSNMNGLELVLTALAGISLAKLVGEIGELITGSGRSLLEFFIGGSGAGLKGSADEAKGALDALGDAIGGGKGGGGLVGKMTELGEKIFDVGAQLEGTGGFTGKVGSFLGELGGGLAELAQGVGVVATGLGPLGLLGVVATVGAGVVALTGEIDTLSKIGFLEGGLSAEEYAQNVMNMSESIVTAQENVRLLAECGGDLTMAQNELDHATIAYHNSLQQLAESLGLSVEELQRQIEVAGGNVMQIEALKNNTRDLGNQTQEYNQVLKEQGTVLGENKQVIDGIVEATTTEAQAVNTSAEKTRDAADATAEANRQLNEMPQAADNAGRGAENVGAKAEEGASKTETEMSDMKENVVASVEAMKDTTLEHFDTMKERVSDTVDTLKEEVLNKFDEMKERVVDTTTQMTDEVNNRTEELRSRTIDALNHISNLVTQEMAHIRDIVVQSMQEMDAVVGGGWASMVATTSNGVREMSSTVTYGLSGVVGSARVWGSDLVRNFADGMYDSYYYLTSTLSYIASTVNAYLGFSEPEKGPLSDFHTYGPDMMQLYADGIEKGKGKLIDAISSVAESVADGLENGGTIGMNLSGINAANIPFKMPVVAGGGLLPYGVGVDDSATSTVQAMASDASQMNSEIVDYLSRILQAVCDGKIIALDKYKFGEVVWKTMESEARAKGKSVF